MAVKTSFAPAGSPFSPFKKHKTFQSQGTVVGAGLLNHSRPVSQDAAAPPAPKATPAPKPPTPDYMTDPIYQGAVNTANKGYGDTIDSIDATQGNVIKSYGIEDASDPFSRAKLLQQSFDRAKASSGVNFAARGQLYAGSLQNAQNTNQSNYTQGYDALAKQYQSVLADLAQRRRDAASARDGSIGAAGGEALGRVLATRPDSPALPAAGTEPKVVSTSAQPTTGTKTSKPKAGFQFVAQSGPRKGQSYNLIVKGGKRFHKYADGKVIAV